MQIAHRKTQTDHKLLSDRTEALASRLNATHADIRSVEHGLEDAGELYTRMRVAEDLLAELQGRLSSAETALAEAKSQAETSRMEAEANLVATQVSPCTHAPSALGAHMAQSDVSTPTRKRKRAEDDAVEEADDDYVRPPKAQRRKRGRRLARAAMHTAAAAAVGAVAAWSALAFA
jgi:hypothetical protein